MTPSPVLVIAVPGVPRPQGSKQAFLRGGRPVLVEASRAVKSWRDTVRVHAVAAAQQQSWEPLTGEVAVSLQFVLPRPQRARGRATAAKAPDVDKAARAVLDALTAVAYGDDKQVTELWAAKRTADSGEHPGVAVHVTPIPEGEPRNAGHVQRLRLLRLQSAGVLLP